MSTKKISELTAAGTLAGTEVVPIVQSAATVRTTATAIANTASALPAHTSGTITPTTDDGAALGTTSLKWSDLFLATGAVINFNAGDVTVTHSTNTLTFAGASSGYAFDGPVSGTTLTGSSSIKSSSATAGVGYATGAGLAVTQATSRTTGVTINAVCGAITLVSAGGSATAASFTVTNSAVAATDVVILSQKSGTDKYVLNVSAVGAGSFEVTFYTTGGTTTEQPVFNFAVINAVAA